MRLTIVGSGTVVPEAGRACASIWVEAGDARVLLDAGPGATQHMVRFGLPWSSLTHVAITHFHADHTGDLPYLMFALTHALPRRRTEPLTLLGPAGTMERLRALGDAFGTFILHPGVRLNVRELGDSHVAELASGVDLRVHATGHTAHSIAYRLDTADGALAYTGDTGPDDELAAWLLGVRTLVAECSLPDALALPGHLTPSGVAALARVVRPERLVLTHVYPQLDRATLPALVRQAGWEGEVIVAEDGLALEA